MVQLPLVVGVDGSDASLSAVNWAADEAVRHGLLLRVVYASMWEHYEPAVPDFRLRRAGGRSYADHLVASASERAERLSPGLKVTADVLSRDPAEALLDEGRHAFAVVVGHRGRGEVTDWLLGSTSLTVAGRAWCPVVVVRGRWTVSAGRVVLGVSDPSQGSAALDFALREAELRNSRLEAVRAWRSPSRAAGERLPGEAGTRQRANALTLIDEALAGAADGLERTRVVPVAVEASAGRALVEAAAGADLLVVGARRRSGGFGLQLGPVNHAVLHHAPCPVAVVPQVG